MSTSGRVALVTGGSGGIGRGIAARLAAEGATVAVAARRADGCQETVRQIEAAGGQAEFTVLDVTERRGGRGLGPRRRGALRPDRLAGQQRRA